MAHIVTKPARPGSGRVDNGAVLVEGDQISVVGSNDVLRAADPDAKIIGSGDDIVIPGLIDARTGTRAEWSTAPLALWADAFPDDKGPAAPIVAVTESPHLTRPPRHPIA